MHPHNVFFRNFIQLTTTVPFRFLISIDYIWLRKPNRNFKKVMKKHNVCQFIYLY